jgi:competence protein ComEA
VTGSVFHADEVADAAVSLERLDWDGQPVDLGQEWKDSLGIERGDKTAAGGEEQEPDWLKTGLTSGSFSASTPTEEPASVSGSENDIPEFLREAGWGKDTGAYQEGPGTSEISDEASDDSELAEGDLPDWIKAMAPTGAGVADSSSQDVTDEDLTQDDVPDWLQGLGDAQEPTAEEQTLEQGDLPDWLAAMKPAEEAPQEPQIEDEPVAEPFDEGDLPDWLKSVQPEEEKLTAQEVSDEPQPEIPLETPQEPAQEFPEMTAESLSDWQFGDEESAGAVDFDTTDTGALGTSADEQNDAIAWLESLAAKHGAKPEELVSDPDARKETEPDWVQRARAVKDQGAAEEPLAEPSEDLPDFLAEKFSGPAEELDSEVAPVDNLGTSSEEQDDAIAWLESLAAKHGAKPEELVTDPDARKETAPDWVQKAAEATSAAQVPAEAEDEESAEEPLESIPEWIEPASEEEGTLSPELEDTQPQKALPRAGADETGTWLRDLGEAGDVVSEQEPTTEPESLAMGTDEDMPDWLRGVEAEPPQAEAGPTSGEEAQEVPDWLSEPEGEPSKTEAGPPPEAEGPTSEDKAQEVPDWLSELEGEPSKTEAGPPSEEGQEQDVPDWLLGVETEPSEGESLPAAQAEEALEPEAGPTPEAEAQEIPDWLSEVETEPSEGESFPAFPSEEETDFEPDQEVVSKSDLNSASIEQLALPGIGESLARDIVAHRETYGVFSSIDDLSRIGGIGQSTIDDLRAQAEVQAGEPDITDWLQSVEPEETGTQVEETVGEETPSDDLPSWLAGLEEKEAQPETPVADADDDLPEWLRGMDEQEPLQTEPTTPTDWQAADVEVPAWEVPGEPETEPEQGMEEPTVQAAPPEASEPIFEPEPEPTAPPEPEPYQEPVTQVSSGMPSAAQEPALTQAQFELTRGNVPGALDSYEKLIRKGRMLDEIIFDLREALYRYPVDVSILQALGDAYMRANRLQDALDAYTKAEELLR